MRSRTVLSIVLVLAAASVWALPPGAGAQAKGDIVCLDGEAPIPGVGCPPEGTRRDPPPVAPPTTSPPQTQSGVCAPRVPFFPNLNDTCRWANDRECDEPRYGGTGACPDGTDTSDCRGRGGIGPDSCPWSYSGTCNEARYGCDGACPSGTDTADCTGTSGGAAWPAPATTAPAAPGANSCRYANDGECDDPSVPGHLTSACAPGTDANDCAGLGADPGNSCRWARDGECDDPSVPGHVTTACAPGTDNADCGR